MANDRLMMRCLGCGETHVVLTYWGAGEFHDVPYVSRPSEGGSTFEKETLAQWATHHGRDCINYFGNDLDDLEDAFELVTEKAFTR